MRIQRSIRLLLWLGLAGIAPASFATADDGACQGACGNGVLDDGEACDDGNRFAGDCCSPDCRIEESHLGCAGECLCATCDDGIDNDGDGRADAEDPKCATLAGVQRFAWVDPGVLSPPVGSRVAFALALPFAPDGALAGSARAGVCNSESGACACPEIDAQCQSAGRPCGRDADCEPAPYPAGESRAWVCTGEDTLTGGCAAAAARLRAEIDMIGSLPGLAMGDVTASDAASPTELNFAAGVHVVDVEALAVGAGAELVLHGAAETTVVLRVATALEVGRAGRVRVGGELAPDRVLWVLSAGSRFELAADCHFVGTLLADDRAQVALGRACFWDGAALGAAPGPS